MKIVKDIPFGVYVAFVGDKIVANEDGEYLSIAAKEGDSKRIQQLLDAAKSYGLENVRAVFLSGHRKIDNEEYERQRQRMQFGLVPDENDIGALQDEIAYRKQFG